MKDLRVKYTNKSFIDLAPVKRDNAVQFLTVEGEQKLVQSLVKLFLTPVELHIFGYGVDHGNITVDGIIDSLKFYNETTQTTDPSELIDLVDVQQISFNEFEVTITTQKGTKLTFTVGV